MSKLVPAIKPASCVSWTFAFTRGGLNNSYASDLFLCAQRLRGASVDRVHDVLAQLHAVLPAAAWCCSGCRCCCRRRGHAGDEVLPLFVLAFLIRPTLRARHVHHGKVLVDVAEVVHHGGRRVRRRPLGWRHPRREHRRLRRGPRCLRCSPSGLRRPRSEQRRPWRCCLVHHVIVAGRVLLHRGVGFCRCGACKSRCWCSLASFCCTLDSAIYALREHVLNAFTACSRETRAHDAACP